MMIKWKIVMNPSMNTLHLIQHIILIQEIDFR